MPEAPTATAAPALSVTPVSSSMNARDQFLATVGNEKARQLIADLRGGDLYNWASLFRKTDGFGAVSDIKRRVTWLRSVEARYETLLYPGERIEFVTKGTLCDPLEQYLLRVWSSLINRTLFIFTTFRVILINCDEKGRAKTMMWQIPYDRLRKFKIGWTGATCFKLTGGKTLMFSGIMAADRERLKDYVDFRQQSTQKTEFHFPSHADRDCLCPSCATPIPAKTWACGECGEKFITPGKTALMSLAVPGLGHAYLGHRMLALVEMLSFGLLLFILMTLVTTKGISVLPVAALVLLVANGFDALITLKVARKGLIPKSRGWKG